MTPAIKVLEKAGIAHQVTRYETNQRAGAYGLEAVKQLGLTPDAVFKTLVAETDSQGFIVALVPVSGQLNLKKLAAAVATKKTYMAEPDTVEKLTGYVLGGVSPLGQKKRLKTIIDTSAERLEKIHISGGKRGLEISLAPSDLAKATKADFFKICQ